MDTYQVAYKRTVSIFISHPGEQANDVGMELMTARMLEGLRRMNIMFVPGGRYIRVSGACQDQRDGESPHSL
ncbi:MAG: hypothetical protein ACO3K8_12050 [Pseudohongiellaceae bacterium]|jgi:hypothetical protein